jgi:hypothetical protein
MGIRPFSENQSSLDARARRRAISMGLQLIKERPSAANPNPGYRLLDAKGKIVLGPNLSLEQVLAYCDPAKEAFQPQGVLGQKLRELCEAQNCSMNALTVLASDNDPYRWDTKRAHLLGQWFKEMVDRFVPRYAIVHLRGMHYRISSAADVLRPSYPNRCLQWVPYVNDFPNWQFVSEDASEAARWLGYVPFDRIVDERNAPAQIFTPEDIHTQRRSAFHGISAGGVYGEVKFLDDLWAWAHITYKQPYRIVFIGEKSSLREVLEPIARRVEGELLLPNGELSISHLYEMCVRAVADGRPVVVLYFSDFDPAGFHMPTNVARRIQALRDLRFPDLDIEVQHVALTLEQCSGTEEDGTPYELPSTPLKETELRAEGWKERWGREQTEIDALAALRPQVLTQIATDAVAPYFDLGAARRRAQRIEEWRQEATQILENHPEYNAAKERIAKAKADAEKAIEECRAINARERLSLERSVQLPRIEPIDLELAAPDGQPVYTSDDDWVEATRKLKERKALVPDDQS